MPHFFRYSADKLPVSCIVALSLADLAVYLTLDDPLFLCGWLLVSFGPKACICAWNHHHQHLPTFRSVILNRLLEVLYGLHTGITTNAWVLHHNLGHHLNYLDQTRDESAWKDGRGRRMGVFRYTLTVALTGYWRAYKVGRRHPKYQRGFLACGVLVVCLLGVLTWYRPLQALTVYLIPMVAGLTVTAWHTFYHHSGLDTRDPLEASHNITHRWYNLFTGNLGYHTAHHMKPGLHWSLLPEYHSEIAPRIPERLFVDPCVPFRWFPG